LVKILIVAYHFEVTGARYIAEAFKRLGCDVRHIGEKVPLQSAWGCPVTPGYEWIPDGGYDRFWADWKPDFILLADTLVKDYLPTLGYMSIPMLYWSNDSHVRNVRREGIAHYFLAHKHGRAQPVAYADETWLPCAHDDFWFKPSLIPWETRAIDVCLIGVMYERRMKLVSMLKAAGFRVFAGTGQIYDNYAQLYQHSRISLCVSANGDLAQRVFETAAMGCHVLTDPLDDLSDEETNKALGLSGFSVYWSDEECVERVRDLLSEETRGVVLPATAYMQKVVQQKHKWIDRAQVVLDWYAKEFGTHGS
jgi:glycosyl transferase family 1